ncbi:MAG: hypothetical protein KJ069_27370 [Anaerolineae bacterium]|nr:hypothetical protein [Anaerolineae bacterium]
MPLARPGDLLQDNQNNSYRIDKYLGEGVTAEVYKATREDNGEVVALKILRPRLPAEIVQSFRDEAVILGELVQYSWQRYTTEPLHIPRVLGRSKERETLEFLVMEFVAGQPLDELIVTTQGLITGSRETEALMIARQVLQVLVVLHDDIRRSYADFQLKNIWWLSEQSLAKVMDWNHVSVRAKEGAVPPGAVNDLIRFGAYLYQLLTGNGAFQTGESEGELAGRAGDKWQRISLGTRTVLLKALHPNPQNRYQTAHEFLVDIETMLNLWQQDEDDLYDEANLALRQAKSRTPQSGSDQTIVAQYVAAVFTASRAINLFILRSREARRVDRMREELEGLTANVSPVWGVGKNYYQLGVYSEALKQWEPEARNLKRLDLWRWVMVAQISRQKAPVLKDDYAPIKALLEEAVAHLDKKEWSRAKEILQQMNGKGLSGPEVYAFAYEADAQELIKQARNAENLGKWNEAGQVYTNAARTLRQIQDETYLYFLATELSTPEQLDEKAALCHQQDQGHEKESQAINEFRLRIAQNNQSVSYLIEQLIQNPGQIRLLDVVLEDAKEMPNEEAIQLLSAAAFYGRAPSAIYELLANKRNAQQQHRDDTHLCQELDLQMEQVNQYLLQMRFDDAQNLLAPMEEQINGIHDVNEQRRRQTGLSEKWNQLNELKTNVGKEVSLGEFITLLNQNDLQELSMKIEKNLQSLEEQLNVVTSENAKLTERNKRLSARLENPRGGGSSWIMVLGLLLLMILLLVGGGYFLKTTQIGPIATQVAGLAGLAELPTTVANFQAEQVAQSATQVASMEELSLTIDHMVKTQAAITPAPPTSLTTAVTETEAPTETPTPIPPVSESLQINPVPAPTLDFSIAQDDDNRISPLELGEPISGGDIDTVFDWPRFDLTLSNDWLFDLSGETVMLRHEGQAESLPLKIQITANSMTETAPLDVMTSWVLSSTGRAEVAMISIDGNSLKDDRLLPDMVAVGWLLPSISSTPLHTAPLTYTPSVTATWLTDNLLRSRPLWDTAYEIPNGDLGITESEVVLNVYGFVCNRRNESLMFFAVALDSNPEQIYWLKNTGTKELNNSENIISRLAGVFDGINECVPE